jgi:hypothetical protein
MHKLFLLIKNKTMNQNHQTATIEVEDLIMDRLEMVAKFLKKKRKKGNIAVNKDMLKAVMMYNQYNN